MQHNLTQLLDSIHSTGITDEDFERAAQEALSTQLAAPLHNYGPLAAPANTRAILMAIRDYLGEQEDVWLSFEQVIRIVKLARGDLPVA